MEKRISFFEFQSVKSVAKAIEPYAQKKERLIPQIEKLTEELQKKQETLDAAKAELEKVTSAINAYEAGIVNIIGFHATDLVKKVIEATEKDGKTIKTTKYVPTDIVSYDDVTKQYVITVPEGNTKSLTENSPAANINPEVLKEVEQTPFNEYGINGDLPFAQPEEKEQEIF